MKILLTGASGFLGSHIMRESLQNGHQVMPLKHSEIKSKAGQVKKFAPDILVHCAWGGVGAADRNNASLQQANIDMSICIFNLYPYKQIVVLGSQDEYGVTQQVVCEETPLAPVSEYAKAKIRLCQLLQRKATKDVFEWQWLRLFNMYGPQQQANWLIPAVVNKCLSGEKVMETTKGEQQYAYLHVDDLARAVVTTFGTKARSGIYNVSASLPYALRDIFTFIKKLTHADIEFRFGALPYRPNQSMMICGNSMKFKAAFGDYEHITLEEGLKDMINDYKTR